MSISFNDILDVDYDAYNNSIIWYNTINTYIEKLSKYHNIIKYEKDTRYSHITGHNIMLGRKSTVFNVKIFINILIGRLIKVDFQIIKLPLDYFHPKSTQCYNLSYVIDNKHMLNYICKLLWVGTTLEDYKLMDYWLKKQKEKRTIKNRINHIRNIDV